MRQDIEEIYIHGYIIRRVSAGNFYDEKMFIENTETGESKEVSEENLGRLLDQFWEDGLRTI